MMAQLDSSIRGGAAVTTPTSEEDLLSVKSDDSDADSECFVVINQAVDDHTRDNTLFTINSKRGSPVEVAAEAMEEVILSSVSAQDLSSKSPSVSLGPMATTPVAPEPRVRDGIVSLNKFQSPKLKLIFADFGGYFSRWTLRTGSAVCGKSSLYQSPGCLFERRRMSCYLLGGISGMIFFEVFSLLLPYSRRKCILMSM